MTTKEKKLIALKALGLNVGDLIKFEDTTKYKVYEKGDDIILKSLTSNSYVISVFHLFLNDWTKLEKVKRIGNTLCKDMNCEYCPLRVIDCSADEMADKTLYNILDSTFDKRDFTKNSKIYRAVKEVLDEEYKDFDK